MLGHDLISGDDTLLCQASIVKIILLSAMLQQSGKVLTPDRLFFFEVLLANHIRQARLVCKCVHILRDLVLYSLVAIFIGRILQLELPNRLDVALRVDEVEVLLIVLSDLCPELAQVLSLLCHLELLRLEHILRLLRLLVVQIEAEAHKLAQ